MNVGQLCNRGAVSLSAGATVSEAAELMCQRRVGSVIITASPCDRPVVVGIVTDRDIVSAQLASTRDLGQLRLADVMTADPLVLNEDEPVAEAIHRMRSRAVRRAPIVGTDGRLVGVISIDDLMTHLAGNITALAQVMRQRPGRDQTQVL